MDRRRLEQPILAEEFRNALGQLNHNKCPGTDRLTTEFYQTFWPEIHEMFCACIQQSITEGCFTVEQQRGVITLIPKKAANRRQVKNWRPITLLNTDYKIVTKAVALRLQSCIKSVIHPDQTGFVKGRYIGTNLRTIQDIIDCQETSVTHHSDPYILSFDYEKAFDSVQWLAIRKALDLFGFGQSFREVVNMILMDPQTCILNAGFTSPYFKPTNGVRQGCCASPLLFILTAELLSIMIRNDQHIRGITLNSTEFRISQFADDTTCFVDLAASAQRLVNIMHMFANYSGLKLNTNKSKVLPLSRTTDPPSKVAGLDLVQKVHILGVWFATNRTIEDHYTWNFQTQIHKMNRTCKSWSNRFLSLKGKITVFNSLVISLLQYVTANSVTPTRVIHEVKEMAHSFVWSGKQNKVAYNTIIQSARQGGPRLMDIETRVKVNLLSWVKRALLSEESSTAETLCLCTKEKDLPLSWGPRPTFRRTYRKGLHFMESCSPHGNNFTILNPATKKRLDGRSFGITVISPPKEIHSQEKNGLDGFKLASKPSMTFVCQVKAD